MARPKKVDQAKILSAIAELLVSGGSAADWDALCAEHKVSADVLERLKQQARNWLRSQFEFAAASHKNRKWIRPGEVLRITMAVEVVSISGRKANLKVLGSPSVECVPAVFENQLLVASVIMARVLGSWQS